MFERPGYSLVKWLENDGAVKGGKKTALTFFR
jgi:hypothetical protein